MNIVIIGGGNMGLALARAVLAKNLADRDSITIVERNAEQCSALQSELKCKVLCSKDLSETPLQPSSVVVLSVKAVDLHAATAPLKSSLSGDQLVVSTLAGTPVKKLRAALGDYHKVIRTMPNLPAQIGMGTTLMFEDPKLDQADINTAKEIFDALGWVFQVKDESLVDAGTAVAGSGPAYLYFFIEHWIAAAEQLGFDSNSARELVLKTCDGSLQLLSRTGQLPSQLRAAVTSKGGTTAAAMEVLDNTNAASNFVDAIKAACQRAAEISNR